MHHRIRQRATQDFGQHFNRQGLGAAIAVALGGPVLYLLVEGSKQASTQVVSWALSGLAPLGALLLGTYGWSCFRAPLHVARAELAEANAHAAELVTEVETLNANLAAFDGRLAVARRQLGVELRDVRHRIEIVRGTRPNPQYSHGFTLPMARWEQYGDVLAASVDLFRSVEPAYAAASHLHAVLEMRRTRSGDPMRQLAVIAEDRLDQAYESAGTALDALGERHGEIWETDYDRAIRGVVEDLVSDVPNNLEATLASKYAQAVLSAYRDIINTGAELLKELNEGVKEGRVQGDLRLRTDQWIGRSVAWANDTNGPLSHDQRQAFRTAPTGPIPNIALLAEIVSDNLNVLRSLWALVEQ